MLIHQNTLISESLFDTRFVCDLDACKGACCVQGDSGAPLEENEKHILKEIWNGVKPFLPARGVAAVEEQGTSVIDADGDLSTPLVKGKECAYTVFKNGIATCGIEIAWKAGKVPFQKPISCHLYPIRITKVGEYDALNYESIPICKPGCSLGEKLGQPVFRFLKDSITRKYGEAYYEGLEELYSDWRK